MLCTCAVATLIVCWHVTTSTRTAVASMVLLGGIDFNSSAVREHIMNHMLVLPVMLVEMIPCTGGTRWQHINSRSDSGFLRLKKKALYTLQEIVV